MTLTTTSEVSSKATRQDLLPIGGIVPLTTTDYPGQLSMVIFTQGCPWRCPYCHNADLQTARNKSTQSWSQVRELLEDRRGFLDAVVFSGGEPTLHAGLQKALREVREMGYLAGLHTAGAYPQRLADLLPWLDWVGLDIKAPFDHHYEQLTGDPRSVSKVRQSLQLLLNSSVSFQLRTTVGPRALSEDGFESIAKQLRAMDAPESVRQDVRPVGSSR